MLRKVPANLDPRLALKNTQEPKWVTLECELVTPMYGGGVAAHTVDEKMPIRVNSIRGQLRFWWRLLATHLWRLGDTNVIRQAEADLWGGIDDKTKASKVFLRVNNIKSLNIACWAKYETNQKGNKVLRAETWANVPYVLFPAQGKAEFGKVIEEPHELAKAGLSWQLDICFSENLPLNPKKPDYNPNITNKQREQVWEAIRWWSQFGGLGARTRRGLGAVRLTQVTGSNTADNLRAPISEQEAQQAGCRLLLRIPQNSAYAAWQEAITRLQKFRQVDVGRASHTNRSRWPEPDTIRRITGQHLILDGKTHIPEHKAGNAFPRAAFGLPIIFKFKDDSLSKKSRENSSNRPEPQPTTLTPKLPKGQDERMASPLILRPFYTTDKKWASAALLLPYAHINNLMLDLSGQDVTYWNPAQAVHVPPIQQHNGTDALTAFMNYFAK